MVAAENTCHKEEKYFIYQRNNISDYTKEHSR